MSTHVRTRVIARAIDDPQQRELERPRALSFRVRILLVLRYCFDERWWNTNAVAFLREFCCGDIAENKEKVNGEKLD